MFAHSSKRAMPNYTINASVLSKLTEFWYLFKRLWGSIFKTLDYWGGDRMFGSGALCWNCSFYLQEEIKVFNLRNIKRRCRHFLKLIKNLVESLSKFVIMSVLHAYFHFWLSLHNVWTQTCFCYACNVNIYFIY